MADEKEVRPNEEMRTPVQKSPIEDDLEGRIEQAKKYREALAEQEALGGAKQSITNDKKSSEGSSGLSQEEAMKMTVERSYIHGLREEAKENRIAKETLEREVGDMKKILSDYFQVENTQALKEKLETERRSKEQDEEGRLSKIDVMEKKLREADRKLEEERIKYEQDRQELQKQRDKIIVQNSLIQAAVAHDVANPKQLLRLLENEFYVDPDRLIPLYKASEGPIPLEERVKIFLDEPENWNLVRSKIAQGGGSSGSAGISSKPVLSKAELRDMRKNRPEEYKARQAEILRAYKEGRVMD